MNIEIRVNTIEEAYTLMESQVNIIAVGNENCVYKVPKYDEIRDLVNEARNNNKKIRVVFPKTPNIHFDNMLELLEKIANLDVLVTINDYGLMFRAKDIKLMNGFAIGRVLAFSLLTSSPWYDLLVEGENQEIKKALATSNMDSTYKLDFVKTLGANEIEIEYLKEVCENTERIIEKTFKLSAHYESCLVGYSRCCPVKKMLQEETSTCAEEIACSEPYYIEFKEKFNTIPVQNKKNNYNSMTHYVEDELVKKIFTPLMVVGNGLYKKNENNNFEYKNVSTMIINSVFYDDKEHLENVFELLKIKKEISECSIVKKQIG
ncbi:hypothetical protein [Vallitalea guaymasensis]|uniref:hypothetical protein n=1 Tax=Vallitalea guaymasensis TaxID=1185412 RepID=UPI000DE420AE|nr:hypothetical protein [Vallitalea guaymasensis]